MCADAGLLRLPRHARRQHTRNEPGRLDVAVEALRRAVLPDVRPGQREGAISVNKVADSRRALSELLKDELGLSMHMVKQACDAFC